MVVIPKKFKIDRSSPRKKMLVSCNSLKKNRVGRSVKYFLINFLVKNVCFMHVLRCFGVGRAKKTLG